VQSYQAGRLDEARVDFDDAVDTMLTSGLDIKADPQLSDEFDHLLSAVNSLEMDAVQQGNGLSPKVEAAPLDTANEVTFPANPELTGRVANELKTTQSDFPLVINDYVAGFISYFSNNSAGHAHLVASLERAGKYKAMIQKTLQAEGMPQDLIYLAVAESGFQPQALNARSGAGGMWQFMPFADSYGLVRNGWVDERFDPQKSTVAYARYMKELYNQFGDWYLAMAAYNWGPGNVQRAVQRTGYADFWQLYKMNALPGETKNYVPGIIAAIIMAKNPKQYGLADVVPLPPVVSDSVTVDYAVNLPLVADVTDSTLQEIVALNPSLLRLTTPADLPVDLHLPPGTKDLFSSRMKEIPEEKRATWRFHEVKEGETLESIAAAMHTRAAEIAEANDIAVKDGVEEGDDLAVPVVAAATDHPQRYKVRRGDTLVTVADRFGVTVSQLRQWNHLRSSRTVPSGKTLYVSQPVRLAPATRVRKSRSAHRRSTATRSRSTHGGTGGKTASTKRTAQKPAGKTAAKKPAAKKPAAKKAASKKAKR
jgi:membrane-bound lytic murein transglycosylase D